MNELTSLTTCAKVLGITPMSLSRWLRQLPDVTVHKISSSTYAVRPSEVRAALLRAGKLPIGSRKRKSTKKRGVHV